MTSRVRWTLAIAASVGLLALVVGLIVALQPAKPSTQPPAELQPIPSATVEDHVAIEGRIGVDGSVEISADGRNLAVDKIKRTYDGFEVVVPLTVGLHRIHVDVSESGVDRAIDVVVIRHPAFAAAPVFLTVRPGDDDGTYVIALHTDPLMHLEVEGAEVTDLASDRTGLSGWHRLDQFADRDGRLMVTVRTDPRRRPMVRLRSVNDAGQEGAATPWTDLSSPLPETSDSDFVQAGGRITNVTFDVTPTTVTRHVTISMPTSSEELVHLTGVAPDQMDLPEGQSRGAPQLSADKLLQRYVPDVELSRNAEVLSACQRFGDYLEVPHPTMTIADGVAVVELENRVFVPGPEFPSNLLPGTTLTVCAADGFPYPGDRGSLEVRVTGFDLASVSRVPDERKVDGGATAVAFDHVDDHTDIDIGLRRSVPLIVSQLFAQPFSLLEPEGGTPIFAITLLLSSLVSLLTIGLLYSLIRHRDATRRQGLGFLGIVIGLGYFAYLALDLGWNWATGGSSTQAEATDILAISGVVVPAIVVAVGLFALIVAVARIVGATGARWLPWLLPTTLGLVLIAVIPTGPFAALDYASTPSDVVRLVDNGMSGALPVAFIVVGIGLLVTLLSATRRADDEVDDETAFAADDTFARDIATLLFALYAIGAGGTLVGLPVAFLLGLWGYRRFVLDPPERALALARVAPYLRDHREALMHERLRTEPTNASGAVRAARPAGVSSNDVLAVGGIDRRADVASAVKVALVPALFFVTFVAIDVLRQGRSLTFGLQAVVGSVLVSLGTWLLIAALFALTFDRLREPSGLRKAGWMAGAIVLLTLPFDVARLAFSGGNLASAFFSALQVVVVLMLVGLSFDLAALSVVHRQWWLNPRQTASDLITVSGARYLLGIGGAVVASIGVTIATFLTGQLTSLLTGVASTVLTGPQR